MEELEVSARSKQRCERLLDYKSKEDDDNLFSISTNCWESEIVANSMTGKPEQASKNAKQLSNKNMQINVSLI